jgi:hypothetical protein
VLFQSGPGFYSYFPATVTFPHSYKYIYIFVPMCLTSGYATPYPACLLLSFLLFPPFAGFFYITSIIPYLSASYNILYLPLCNPSHPLAFTCPLYPHFRFFDLFIDSFFCIHLYYTPFAHLPYIISGIEFKLFDHFKG